VRRTFQAVVFVLGAIVPGALLAQRLGLFFDEAATSCTTTITGFQQVHVYLNAFMPAVVPTDSSIGGALFSVQLPPMVHIVPKSVTLRDVLIYSVDGDLDNLYNLNIRFRNCQARSTGSPLQLLEFDVYDSGGSTRPNLVMQITGSGTDSLQGIVPRYGICDPNDRDIYLGYVNAPSIDATFNCTHHCYCTTAIESRSWSAVKSLYREP
jgi:hypothetical protein